MIRGYQLMIMRLLLLQQHQSHDHELDRGPARELDCEPARELKLVARGEVGR